MSGSNRKVKPRRKTTRQKRIRLLRYIFGETIQNLNTKKFVDPKNVFLDTQYILFCRVGRSAKFDRCCFLALNAIIDVLNRIDISVYLVFVLTDHTKRSSTQNLIQETILNENPLFTSPRKMETNEDSTIDSEATSTSQSQKGPQLYFFADQQEETILQFPEGYEEEFDYFEQIQRYSHLNINKFFDGIEYWHDRNMFGKDPILPPYSSSSSSHLGPSFILMDMNSKDQVGLSVKLDWNFFAPTSGITSVVFHLPRIVEQWKEAFDSMQSDPTNSFVLYNPEVLKCNDFFEYRRKMRAEKARLLKIKEQVASQRYDVLFYDVIDFMKRVPQKNVPKDKISRVIRLLTGEDIPNFAPASQDGIVFLYYTAPTSDFRIEEQDFLPQLIKFNEQLQQKYGKYFKIWWIPDLSLDEAQTNKKLLKEVNYIINRFQDILEPHGIEIVDKCFKSVSCIKELLISRPSPPVLVALDLKSTKHVLAVDFKANLNVDALQDNPIAMFKIWAKMLGVTIS